MAKRIDKPSRESAARRVVIYGLTLREHAKAAARAAAEGRTLSMWGTRVLREALARPTDA